MALVKWTTPKVVRRYEWYAHGKPELLRMSGYVAKWTLLLGLPTLYALWRMAPAELHRVSMAFLDAPLFLCFYLGIGMKLYISIGRPYRVDSNGLSYRVTKDEVRIHWHQMQSWTIGDHPRIAGIRILTIKATRLRRLRTFTFPFNPRTTDEARLRLLLREHVRAQ